MRHWTESSLVQVMACHLIGAKPLPTPMLTSCQLDSWEHDSVKFESELSRKCNEQYLLPKCPPNNVLCTLARNREILYLYNRRVSKASCEMAYSKWCFRQSVSHLYLLMHINVCISISSRQLSLGCYHSYKYIGQGISLHDEMNHTIYAATFFYFLTTNSTFVTDIPCMYRFIQHDKVVI